MSICILAIESSCDDTSAAVIVDGNVLSNITSSQQMHREYGGVVPEVASRAHNVSIVPVVLSALEEAGVDRSDLTAVACTRGPGLMGSLMVGFTFAKAFARGLEIPLIEVHHLQAHILAHFIDPPRPRFPFLCLTVSGGHTQLVVVRDYQDMELIGQTLDDAAGEAFDKTGKMLGLPYPAGPEMDKIASTGKVIFDFPEPQIPGLDFSFSGLKTAVLYFLKKELDKDPDFIKDNLRDLCASIQDRIVTILLNKLEKAVAETGITEVAIAGGVSANKGLRSGLRYLAENRGWQTYIPSLQYCTDNAGMIAMTAHHKYLAGDISPFDRQPDPRLPWNPEASG